VDNFMELNRSQMSPKNVAGKCCGQISQTNVAAECHRQMSETNVPDKCLKLQTNVADRRQMSPKGNFFSILGEDFPP